MANLKELEERHTNIDITKENSIEKQFYLELHRDDPPFNPKDRIFTGVSYQDKRGVWYGSSQYVWAKQLDGRRYIIGMDHHYNFKLKFIDIVWDDRMFNKKLDEIWGIWCGCPTK